MRRLIIAVSIALVVIVILLVLGATLLNVDHFRPRIQAELQNKLGRPVTLGTLHLHLFPLSIKVDGLSIAESPAFGSSRPFATAKEVYASASLMSLIHGEPQINDLRLNQPEIELIRNPSGVWNYATLGSTSANQPSPGAPPAPVPAPQAAPSGQQPALTLNQLQITNGSVAVTDQHTKSPRAVYNHIDLSLTDFAPGKPFNIDAAAHVPGSGKELVEFRGKAGPLATGGAEQTPVSGHLSLEQVSLAGINGVAPGTIPPNTDAVVSGAADIGSASDVISCKGTLTLDNAVVRGAKVDAPINANYDVKLNQKTDQIAVSSASVKVGPTAVALSGTVDSGVTPSTLNVRVVTNNASITELSRLAGLFGVAFDANDQVKGSISADLTATGPATSPAVQGNLSASSIQAQEIALSNVHATCKMNNGVVTLAPVTAGIFGGQEDGTITVDTKPAHPLCTVKSHLTGVDANALLSSVSSVKNTLYGSLAADGNLNFAVDASTNLARTLNGTVNFNLTNGRLQNVNILNEISKIAKFAGSTPSQSGTATPLQKFSGTVDIKNGLATTNNLVAVIPEGSLSANGSLNLVDEGVNMHMNAVLASSTSKAVGGTSVGGFLNTALANNKGELVVPALVTGSMAHPTVTPDVAAIAKMKVNHLLPTSGDPSKLASGLVGALTGAASGNQANQNGNQQQQQQQQQKNPLKSILKGLGK